MQVKDGEVYLVVNAGCREKDLEHINKHLAAYKVWMCAMIEAARPGFLPLAAFPVT